MTVALNVPGPVAVAHLVAEGASAVKVEPLTGDPLAGYSRSWYDELHAGVEVLRLDLKSPSGRAALDHLLAESDLVVTSQRPAALDRLGLGPAALALRHPQLRAVGIVGDVRAPDVPGHDVTYQADAGLLRGGLPLTFFADLAGAERVVSALLLALRDAPGTHRVVGLSDTLQDFTAPLRHGLTRPGDRFGGGDPAYGVYRTADGAVAVAALEPHFRSRLYLALSLPLDAPLEQVMATRTCAEWAAFATVHDLPLAIVRRS